MRSVLSEYYPLNPSERDALMASAQIVLDANVMLTLYRMASDDRRLVLDLLDAVKHRLWVPYQAAEEFQRNRLDVYEEQLAAYEKLIEALKKLRGQLVDSVQEHPVLSQQDIKREIGDRLSGLERFIRERKDDRHPEDLLDPAKTDGVREALDALLDGRVGSRVELTDTRLAEAKRRFDKKIPPGYEDAKKPVPQCYGDYFLWDEALTYVAGLPDEQRLLILVTEEKKEDWWLHGSGRSIVGPRPELLREATSRGIRTFQMMSLKRFFKAMSSHLGWERTDLGDFVSVDSGRSAVALEPDGSVVERDPELAPRSAGGDDPLPEESG